MNEEQFAGLIDRLDSIVSYVGEAAAETSRAVTRLDDIHEQLGEVIRAVQDADGDITGTIDETNRLLRRK